MQASGILLAVQTTRLLVETAHSGRKAKETEDRGDMYLPLQRCTRRERPGRTCHLPVEVVCSHSIVARAGAITRSPAGHGGARATATHGQSIRTAVVGIVEQLRRIDYPGEISP
ncbi:MAG TPA: hypothetical protein VKB35_14825 [Ktedonobacteraceae bacterium]|nr:hypothetical protein [Ktedonobacteraceae bacterium]